MFISYLLVLLKDPLTELFCKLIEIIQLLLEADSYPSYLRVILMLHEMILFIKRPLVKKFGHINGCSR